MDALDLIFYLAYGAIAILVPIIIYIYGKSDWNFRTIYLMQRLPGPRSQFIIGNALDFIFLKTDGIFNILKTRAESFKNIYAMWMGWYAITLLTHPEDIEKLLSSTKQIEKSTLYFILAPWLQEGLLTSKGAKWHNRRKLLTPAFHFSILRKFSDVFAKQSAKIAAAMKKECEKPHTNIIDYITEFALLTINETAMGYPMEKEDSKLIKYKKALYGFGKTSVYRLVRPWFYSDIIFYFTVCGFKSRKFVETLQDFTRNVIAKRLKKWDRSILDNIDKETEGAGKRKLAMLDLLISQKMEGADIDDEGIAEEVDTFVFEGHDTTTYGICYTLMLIANHPDIQDKIVEELNEIFDDDPDRLPTYNDLQKMMYLERCIKEGLRLYPPVSFIGRKLGEDLVLKDYTVPAKSQVVVQIFHLHRNPEFWPNPDVFDPDRFLPENSRGRHPFSYIPFSAGPRNCIGQKFALLEEKALISTVLRNFILKPVDTPQSIQLIVDVILRTKDNIKIKFLPRR